MAMTRAGRSFRPPIGRHGSRAPKDRNTELQSRADASNRSSLFAAEVGFEISYEFRRRVFGKKDLPVASLQPLIFLDGQQHIPRTAVLGDDDRRIEGQVAVVGELAE